MIETNKEFVKSRRKAIADITNYDSVADLVVKDLLDACDRIEQQATDIEEIHTDQIEVMDIQIEQLEAELATEKADREIEKTVDSDAILGLRAENEQQQAELAKHRWIPVSERLPKNKEPCYWLPKNFIDKIEVCIFRYFTKKKTEFVRDFSHWRPIILPQAEEILKE